MHSKCALSPKDTKTKTQKQRHKNKDTKTKTQKQRHKNKGTKTKALKNKAIKISHQNKPSK
jgi:hypothetical protein